MSLRTRLGRLEAAMPHSPTPSPADEFDYDLRVPGQLARAFAAKLAAGHLDSAPLAPEILRDLETASTPWELHKAEQAAVGLLSGLAFGFPPVQPELWAELAAWFQRNRARLSALTRGPGEFLRISDTEKTSVEQIITDLWSGPKALLASEVQAQLLYLRQAYGDEPPPPLGGI